MDDQNRNLILAVVLSGVVMMGWMYFFPPADAPVDPNATAVTVDATVPSLGEGDAASGAPETASAATEAARIDIDTPRLTGSILLQGGRIDQLSLKDYNETLDADSGLVELLSPVSQDNAYYAVFGWAPGGALSNADVPGADTLWQLASGATLTPETPVTLTWSNDSGLTFTREISVDADYMFNVTQSVTNTGDAAARLAPYGQIARHGQPDSKKFFVLHEGVVALSDRELSEIKYDDMPDLDADAAWGASAEVKDVAGAGWIGFTDKYWMTSLIPAQGAPFTSVAQYVASHDIYQVVTRMPAVTVEPGQTVSSDSRVFAGAKEWETIRHYQNDEGVTRFVDSIDWGWFFFLTKPMFWVLHWLHGVIGNMGWSIIGLTVLVKALLLPLAYKSYVSMARMKELQPEMEKLKEAAGDDKMKLQQGMMELYRKNKVNPASGCLPLLLQIPIFFSLYKVIFVTIELRHAGWVGWIKDLSSPDPTSILNLFGLLPFAPPSPESFLAILSLGILPILLGISMWLQQKLNPKPADPAQAMIFAWMPWIFMFMLGQFASGLVLYWIANNTITFIQQYTIMRSQGVKPDVLGRITEGFNRKKPAGK